MSNDALGAASLREISFRHSAGFGKRIEYWLVGRMLKHGLDVYLPLVDDFGVDAVIRKPSGEFIEAQIKARSRDIDCDHAALFAAMKPFAVRPNYFFVFYSEWLDVTWILSSNELDQHARVNIDGKNKGKRTIKLSGVQTDRQTKVMVPTCLPQFDKFRDESFSRFR